MSARARALLERSEGLDVEFKQSISGLDGADLVSFANSARGGAILVGVRETRDQSGGQVGEVVGCPVGDGPKLQILDKAMNCVPPVPVTVHVERMGAHAFFRIEIPPSETKPHCTNGGTYKIREDGRIRSLHPDALLALFLEREAKAFRQRFAEATATIEGSLSQTAAMLQEMRSGIEGEISNMAATLGWADSKVDDTASDISVVKSLALTLRKELGDIGARTKAVVQHLGAVDPIKVKTRDTLVAGFQKQLTDDPKLLKAVRDGKEVSLSLEPAVADLFSKDELNEMLKDAVARANK